MIDKNDDLITFPNVNHEKMMNTNVSIHSTYHYNNDNSNKNSNVNKNYYYNDFDLDRNDLLHTKLIDNCYIHNDNIIVELCHHHAHCHHQQLQEQPSYDIFSYDLSVHIRMHHMIMQ
jgi:hypothetical protein